MTITDNNQGWISIHRKILENPIISKPNYLAVWVVLLLLANHTEHSFIWNNQKQICKRGQILTGRKALSEKTGVKESTIENILKYLENEHQIEQQKTTKFRLITIKNYDQYQDIKHQSKQQSNNRVTTNQQQNDTNNNENNYNNENNENKLGEKSPAQIMKEFIISVKNKNSEYRQLVEYIHKQKNIEIIKVSAELDKFVDYWTEKTGSGKKERWQLEKAFEVKRRLVTWFSRLESQKVNNKINIRKI